MAVKPSTWIQPARKPFGALTALNVPALFTAAALAAHSQKGIPAFSIYGHDVQDADDTSIPADVEEKLLRFARAGLAVASMKGKSYLSLGGVSMGIAGSIVDHNFFESAGNESRAVDMTELRRRIDQKIYDEAELEMALARADKNFRYGEDENNKQYQRNAEQSRAVLRESLLMAMCIRDMMQGNSKLADIGRVEESLGYNAIAAGFGGNVTGPINIPMAIPLKRSSTVHLTGMACANRLSWRPKTTVLTAWQC